jgi:hypothetical protein
MKDRDIHELQQAFDGAMESLEVAGRIISALVWHFGVGDDETRILEITEDDQPIFGVHVHTTDTGWALTAHKGE